MDSTFFLALRFTAFSLDRTIQGGGGGLIRTVSGLDTLTIELKVIAEVTVKASDSTLRTQRIT